MKCFHHNDLDGRCSAAIVAKAMLGKMSDKDFIELDYKDSFPFHVIEESEEVIIVDYSLQTPGDFEHLLEITENVVWIDHHKTAIEKHPDMAHLAGIRSLEKAACALTWDYFFPNQLIPYACSLLDDYDTWTFRFGDDTRRFQAGMKLKFNSPLSPIWNNILDRKHRIGELYHYEEIINDGKIALQYQENQYAGVVKSWSFEVMFEGYRAICCNSHERRSQLFDSVYDPEKHDIMIPFIFDGSHWSVSIYATKPEIDVSAIALKYGGGGHKQAAGFVCEKLPLPLALPF